MVIIALTVTGLGWRPSVVVTWLMKVALQIRNFILLTFTLTLFKSFKHGDKAAVVVDSGFHVIDAAARD